MPVDGISPDPYLRLTPESDGNCMILDAYENPAGKTRSASDSRDELPVQPSPACRTLDILSLLDNREAVGLEELAAKLKQRAADVHRSMRSFLDEGTIKCLMPVSLNPTELLDHPDVLPLVYYRAVRDHSSWACRKEQKVSWTRLSKSPHLAAD